MSNTPDKRTECLKFPVAVEKIFSDKALPRLSERTRTELKRTVLAIEGSDEKTALTCISVEDFDAVRRDVLSKFSANTVAPEELEIKKALATSSVWYNEGLRNSIQGNVRGRNRHCDQCATADCENRVDVPSDRLAEESLKRGVHLSSRKAKVLLNRSEEEAHMAAKEKPRSDSSIPPHYSY